METIEFFASFILSLQVVVRNLDFVVCDGRVRHAGNFEVAVGVVFLEVHLCRNWVGDGTLSDESHIFLCEQFRWNLAFAVEASLLDVGQHFSRLRVLLLELCHLLVGLLHELLVGFDGRLSHIACHEKHDALCVANLVEVGLSVLHHLCELLQLLRSNACQGVLDVFLGDDEAELVGFLSQNLVLEELVPHLLADLFFGVVAQVVQEQRLHVFFIAHLCFIVFIRQLLAVHFCFHVRA